MTGAHVRRALRARPRLILGVLLALVVQTVSASGPIGHRHAGGDARHTHAAGSLGGVSPAPRIEHRDDAGGLAIAAAPAAGWHEHVTPATLASATAGPALLASHVAVEHLPFAATTALASADGRTPHARGPPRLA